MISGTLRHRNTQAEVKESPLDLDRILRELHLEKRNLDLKIAFLESKYYPRAIGAHKLARKKQAEARL